MDWDAIDGRNGGAQQTVWGILMEMERFDGKGNGTRSRSLGLGSEPGEGLRAGQSSCGVGLGGAHQLPKEDLASAVRVFLSIRGECSSKDVWRSRSRPKRPFCEGQSGVCLLPRLCCRMH